MMRFTNLPTQVRCMCRFIPTWRRDTLGHETSVIGRGDTAQIGTPVGRRLPLVTRVHLCGRERHRRLSLNCEPCHRIRTLPWTFEQELLQLATRQNDSSLIFSPRAPSRQSSVRASCALSPFTRRVFAVARPCGVLPRISTSPSNAPGCPISLISKRSAHASLRG